MKSVLIQREKVIPVVNKFHRLLVSFGIFSSLYYLAVNIIVPLQNPGYNIASQTVSELSAIDSPTRSLWVVLCIFYSLLLIAFGRGVFLTAGRCRKLRLAAIVIMFDAFWGLFWPPMHQREVIAVGGGTLTDTLHLVWTYIHLILILLMIGFGAAALELKFRIYSVSTVVVFIVFGILTTLESSGIEAGKPTPSIGIWERINIAAYMLWIAMFAIHLLQKEKSS